MATKLLVCRLCWESVPGKRTTSLFTRISLEREWPERISALLEVHVHKDDHLPSHICSACMNRVVTLEQALLDLAALRQSAKTGMRAHKSLKRAKETSSDVGVSPDTQRARP